MKNKLVLNPHGRNHFKFIPALKKVDDDKYEPIFDIPGDEKEQIKMIEKLYKDLLEEGVILYEKVRKGSHSIKCVKLGDVFYVVVCIRNNMETYNNVIHQIVNQNDAIAISKFIGKNIRTTMSDYKKQILDARKMVVRKEEADEKISEDVNQQEIGKKS